ncbi:radial spoke protein Ci-RSP9 [Trypanosoma grayi]|uniref:radial spoke protein Ci-RSP9 n=1 Tax=Trypanosoma grayi TaxID=71804 RepID=UPI0004F3F447|nr:radial spoke protein Ci-RSP9 [Trypanosoma grayi]KEG14119.1 radial spoke protein Ci-RSP9 [Trypanosoma grayi]
MSLADVFPFSHATGHIFSTSERVALSTSLPLLMEKSKRRTMVVWGKVYGYKNDYTIVQAFDDDLVAPPVIYYSIDEGLSFVYLGTADSLMERSVDEAQNAKQKQLLMYKLRGPFMGDPSYEYRVIDDQTGSTASYKESLRLVLFIEAHDYHCRVAPRGAYYRELRNATLPAEIKRNTGFVGLRRAYDEALSLRNYYHLRAENPYLKLIERNEGGLLYEKSGLERLEEDQNLDAVFFPISDDLPGGVWRLRYDPVHNVVLGMSAKFVGSVFYHVPETNKYGTVYMGDGNINHDVAFEI